MLDVIEVEQLTAQLAGGNVFAAFDHFASPLPPEGFGFKASGIAFPIMLMQQIGAESGGTERSSAAISGGSE